MKAKFYMLIWTGLQQIIIICQNLANVHLRFVYFIVYKVYFKIKEICNKPWSLINGIYAEVFELKSAVHQKKKEIN